MQTTLRIRDAIYREAKSQAAREGITMTHFIGEALALRIGAGVGRKASPLAEAAEDRSLAAKAQRNALMGALLERTAQFRIGAKPTREEMHDR
jgi:hypothetical protein